MPVKFPCSSQPERQRAAASFQTPREADSYFVEEVVSGYTYPREYRGSNSVAAQLDSLRRHFPELSPEFGKGMTLARALPRHAEGWFAVPNWQKLASKYDDAVTIVLNRIASSRPFYNWHQGQLGPDHFRAASNGWRTPDANLEAQRADFTLIAAQFGKRHAGRSGRRAMAMMQTDEFPLGVFAVGCMLLAHPERLGHQNDLWVDCAGDRFCPQGVGDFPFAPLFREDHGYIGLVTSALSSVSAQSGCASEFIAGER